jgi:hypothetical protein
LGGVWVSTTACVPQGTHAVSVW